jgi:hypothetical protein
MLMVEGGALSACRVELPITCIDDGSRWTNRSSPSMPRGNSRNPSDRLVESPLSSELGAPRLSA